MQKNPSYSAANVSNIATKQKTKIFMTDIARQNEINHNKRMANYTTTKQKPDLPPGCNVRRLRLERDWSLQYLADQCDPQLSRTTVFRLEENTGFTLDTLRRVAKAFGVKDYELWLPPGLLDYYQLPDDARARVDQQIKEIAGYYRSQRKKHA